MIRQADEYSVLSIQYTVLGPSTGNWVLGTEYSEAGSAYRAEIASARSRTPQTPSRRAPAFAE